MLLKTPITSRFSIFDARVAVKNRKSQILGKDDHRNYDNVKLKFNSYGDIFSTLHSRSENN